MIGRYDRGIELQSRDIALLRDLSDARVMTRRQIARRHFDGSLEAAKKRLQALKAHGLIRERWMGPRQPSALFLGSASITALRRAGSAVSHTAVGRANAPRLSDQFVRHELAVTDVRIAFSKERMRSEHLDVIQFTSAIHFYARIRDGRLGGNNRVLVKPDAFMQLEQRAPAAGTSAASFFIEVDRSTESEGTLAKKVSLYRDYYRSGGFALQCGGRADAYRHHPFRVLMIFLTAARRNRIAARLLVEEPRALTQVWLATLHDVIDNPLGRIWVRPKDYKAALATMSGVSVANDGKTDRRLAVLPDGLIEERVAKHALFDADETRATWK